MNLATKRTVARRTVARKTAPVLTPEQAEIARLKAELANRAVTPVLTPERAEIARLKAELAKRAVTPVLTPEQAEIARLAGRMVPPRPDDGQVRIPMTSNPDPQVEGTPSLALITASDGTPILTVTPSSPTARPGNLAYFQVSPNSKGLRTPFSGHTEKGRATFAFLAEAQRWADLADAGYTPADVVSLLIGAREDLERMSEWHMATYA